MANADKKMAKENPAKKDAGKKDTKIASSMEDPVTKVDAKDAPKKGSFSGSNI